MPSIIGCEVRRYRHRATPTLPLRPRRKRQVQAVVDFPTPPCGADRDNVLHPGISLTPAAPVGKILLVTDVHGSRPDPRSFRDQLCDRIGAGFSRGSPARSRARRCPSSTLMFSPTRGRKSLPVFGSRTSERAVNLFLSD